jgi:hypothetical protein
MCPTAAVHWRIRSPGAGLEDIELLTDTDAVPLNGDQEVDYDFYEWAAAEAAGAAAPRSGREASCLRPRRRFERPGHAARRACGEMPVDDGLLEFLGSVDSDDKNWREYLADTGTDPAARRASTAPGNPGAPAPPAAAAPKRGAGAWRRASAPAPAGRPPP